MRKLTRIYTIALILCIILTSCSIANTMNNEAYDIASIINYLSDDSLQGRLPGTEGNKKAAEYIKDIYIKLGLLPYQEGSYYQSYKHKALDYNTDSLISVFDADGKQISFDYGKDYIDSNAVAGNFTCPIISDINSDNISDSFIVLESGSDISNFIGRAKGILIKSSSLKKYTRYSEGKGTPLIQINEKMFNYLTNNKNLSISYECKYKEEEFDANNVIGVIPGSNHENALILSAHFDHVGTAGSEVFKGVVDNCSGVSILLDIAKKLQTKAKDAPFNFDIYICAFNGEESGFQGSESFVKEIKKRYSNMVNINLDTLGDKNKGILIIGHPNASHTVIHLLSDWFTQNEQDYKVEPDKYSSDHISFENSGIPAITLGQELSDVIHSIGDTTEKVDVDFLGNFSDSIYEFINTTGNKIFDIHSECEYTNEEDTIAEAPETPENQELEKLVDQAKSKLKFGEYIIINAYGKVERIYNNRGEFKNIEELQRIYPELLAPYNSKDYSLEKITVYDYGFQKSDEEISFNKIYTNKLISSNIGLIEFEYSSVKDDSKLIFRFKKKDDELKEPDFGSKSELISDEKGQQYKLAYDRDGKLLNISCEFKAYSSEYTLTVSKGSYKDITLDNETYNNAFVLNWDIKTKEDINSFINSINLNIFQDN